MNGGNTHESKEKMLKPSKSHDRRVYSTHYMDPNVKYEFER
jgi:hypothetical protein